MCVTSIKTRSRTPSLIQVDIESKRIKSIGLWKRLESPEASTSSDPTPHPNHDELILRNVAEAAHEAASSLSPPRRDEQLSKPVMSGTLLRNVPSKSSAPPQEHIILRHDAARKNESIPGSTSLRRFRLAAVAACDSKMSSEHGVHKRGRVQKSAGAICVETKSLLQGHLAMRRTTSMRDVQDLVLSKEQQRDRHHARESEVHGLAEQGSSRLSKSNNCTNEVEDLDSLRLAAELQKFAFRECKISDNRTCELKEPRALRIQPIPLQTHHRGFLEDINDKKHGITAESYVYDIYQHFGDQPANCTIDSRSILRNELLQAFPPNRVGVLVIAGEDQEIWETLLEDNADEGEGGYNSEEEDENGDSSAHRADFHLYLLTNLAEGYYGNDYPEGELEYDDEYESGTYGHRVIALEDEEVVNDDIPYWSDE